MNSHWYSEVTFLEQRKGSQDELWECGEVRLVTPGRLRWERTQRRLLAWLGRRLLAWGTLLTKRSEVAAGAANTSI